MDLRFTPEEIAFRAEVRAFIRDHLPADIRERLRLGHSARKEVSSLGSAYSTARAGRPIPGPAGTAGRAGAQCSA